jgi:hypothetical protein
MAVDPHPSGGCGPSRGATLFLDFSTRLTLNTLSIFFPHPSLHSGGYDMERPSNSARLAPSGTHPFCGEAAPVFLELNRSLNHNSRSIGEGGISPLSLSRDPMRELREEIPSARTVPFLVIKDKFKIFRSSLSKPEGSDAWGVHRSTDKRGRGGAYAREHFLLL